MTLKDQRRWTIVGIFAAGAFFIWAGYDGWLIGRMPAHWLGFIVVGIGIAGLLGFNIFHGGPLDLRNDAEDRGR